MPGDHQAVRTRAVSAEVDWQRRGAAAIRQMDDRGRVLAPAEPSPEETDESGVV